MELREERDGGQEGAGYEAPGTAKRLGERVQPGVPGLGSSTADGRQRAGGPEGRAQADGKIRHVYRSPAPSSRPSWGRSDFPGMSGWSEGLL